MKTNNALTPAQREAIIQKLYGSTATAQEQFLAIAIEQAAIELDRQGRGEPEMYGLRYRSSEVVRDVPMFYSRPAAEEYVERKAASANLDWIEPEIVPLYSAPQPAEPVRRKYLEGLAEADGCFRAAYIEGLTEALSETTDARLKDLIERRILYAHYAIVEAISQPAAPVVKESLTVAEPVKEVSDDEDHIVDLISEYGDHNAEHGRISFDKWTLREAASALLTRYGSKS